MLVQGQPTMQAVHAHWGSQHHAYLAFSSTSTDSTLLMDVSGTHFQQLHLPGLITSQATVLLAASCQNVLVQVTAEVWPSCAHLNFVLQHGPISMPGCSAGLDMGDHA